MQSKDSRNIKVLAFNPGIGSGMSFYRVELPLSRMKKSHPIEWTNITSISQWSELLEYDVLYISRPATPEYYNAINVAKLMGLKVWIDYDDDLIDIPFDNPARKMFERAGVNALESITKICKLANFVTVSTDSLKNKLEKSTGVQKFHVIKNAFDKTLFPYYQKAQKNDKRNNLFMWRGSNTHDRDMATYSKQIVAMSETKDLFFEFCGEPFWQVIEKIPVNKRIMSPVTDAIRYNFHIYNRMPKAFFFPLAKNQFNECKSNIGWIEATFAHALTIAPDLPEWKDLPGALIYKDENEFYFRMEQAAKMSYEEIYNRVKESENHMFENYSLEKQNEKRFNLLTEYLNKSNW